MRKIILPALCAVSLLGTSTIAFAAEPQLKGASTMASMVEDKNSGSTILMEGFAARTGKNGPVNYVLKDETGAVGLYVPVKALARGDIDSCMVRVYGNVATPTGGQRMVNVSRVEVVS